MSRPVEPSLVAVLAAVWSIIGMGEALAVVAFPAQAGALLPVQAVLHLAGAAVAWSWRASLDPWGAW